MTPHAYVLAQRVAKAQNLLEHADLSLSQIAIAVGFADQSHLTRRFRQVAGISPGRYRRFQT